MLKQATFHPQPAPAPRRKPTLLYCIKPEGRGTSQSESLYSFLQRLAYEHSLPPNKLVNITMANDPEVSAALTPNRKEQRVMRRIYREGWGWGWGWDKNAGNLMIGTGLGARSWARALEIATGNQSLEGCTLSKLSYHVSTTKLITTEERVCVECLRSDLEAGRMPYERLLWRMGPVSCCPLHRRPLLPAKCGKPPSESQDPYLRVKHSGVCGGCGAIGFTCVAPPTDTGTPADVWRAEQCAGLLKALNGEWPQASAKMKALIKQRADDVGGIQAFAARVGGSKSIFSNWLKKSSARIAVAQLMDVAWVEGISLPDLLLGDWVPVDMPEASRDPQRKRRTVKRVDHQKLRQAMGTAIMQGQSASEVARAMQVDLSTMRRHADLYMQMRGNTVTHKQAEDEVRRSMAISEAEQIARQLLADGKTLSLRNASELSGTRWYPAQLRAQSLRVMAHVLASGSAPASARIGAPTLKLAIAAAMRLQATT
jgi:hypothetical protein